eukprot:2889546-Prymnesium_polylepis.1
MHCESSIRSFRLGALLARSPPRPARIPRLAPRMPPKPSKHTSAVRAHMRRIGPPSPSSRVK